MTIHDSMAKQLIETLLEQWKVQGNSSILSEKVYLTKSGSTFPSPDGTFYDPQNNFSIALEFKPPTETKRGILTGLGQSIAYLNKHSLSYLLVPSKVEHFNMQKYMLQLFKTNISHKMPIGLVVYDNEDITNILEYIEPSVKILETTLNKKEASKGRYWAKWLDLPLHALWLLVDISYNNNITGVDRKRAIWDSFFLTYIYPKEFREQFNAYDSGIKLVNGKNYQPMHKKLKKWKDLIDKGVLTHEKAILELREATNIQGKGDITYWQYRKNFLPFIDHLGMWDEFGYLSEIGYEVHRIGKIHGATSKTFYHHIAKLLLLEGKHLDLILDIEKYTRNLSLKNKDEALENIIKNLKSKGLISGEGNKKFENEFQLWGQLGLINKIKNTYYVPNNGFNFDWGRITMLLIEE